MYKIYSSEIFFLNNNFELESYQAIIKSQTKYNCLTVILNFRLDSDSGCSSQASIEDLLSVQKDFRVSEKNLYKNNILYSRIRNKY